MVLDQHGILLKMVVMVSQHHLTGRPCWSWLIWLIGVSTRRWGPSPLTMSPDRKVLYVGHRPVSWISNFWNDPNTGGLAQSGTVAPEAAPTFLSTDRTGRYVLSAYYQGAHAAVHPVGTDGAVGGPPMEWLETAIGAHAIQTDPSNTFAFVPHIDNRGGPN